MNTMMIMMMKTSRSIAVVVATLFTATLGVPVAAGADTGSSRNDSRGTAQGRILL